MYSVQYSVWLGRESYVQTVPADARLHFQVIRQGGTNRMITPSQLHWIAFYWSDPCPFQGKTPRSPKVYCEMIQWEKHMVHTEYIPYNLKKLFYYNY